MASRPASFTTIELRAGFLVLLTAAVLAVLLAGVFKYRPNQNMKIFYVYSEDAAGLGRAADVRFGGIIAGHVTEVAPDPGNQSLIRVTLKVFPSTPVNTASLAYVSQVTMTSEKHLAITTGSENAPLLEPGLEIPSTEGGLFGDLAGLTSTAKNLLQDLKALMGISDESGNLSMELEEGETITGLFSTLNATLDDLRVLVGVVDEEGEVVELEGRKTVSELMITLDDTMLESQELLEDIRDVVEENREGISDALATAKDLGDSVEELTEDAQVLMDKLGSVLDDNSENIEATIEGAREALESLDTLMAEFHELTRALRQTIDKNDDTVEDTLRDLSETMRNLKEVTRTLAEQPQSIIRGKKPVGRQ